MRIPASCAPTSIRWCLARTFSKKGSSLRGKGGRNGRRSFSSTDARRGPAVRVSGRYRVPHLGWNLVLAGPSPSAAGTGCARHRAFRGGRVHTRSARARVPWLDGNRTWSFENHHADLSWRGVLPRAHADRVAHAPLRTPSHAPGGAHRQLLGIAAVRRTQRP